MSTLADRGTIDRVRAAHVAALNAGDVEGWLGVFAEDGVQMPPNVPANVGKAAIRPWVEGFRGELEELRRQAEAEIVQAGRWGTTFTLVQTWGRALSSG